MPSQLARSNVGRGEHELVDGHNNVLTSPGATVATECASSTWTYDEFGRAAILLRSRNMV